MPWNPDGTFTLNQTFGTGTAPDNQFPPAVGDTLDDIGTGLNIATIFSYASIVAFPWSTIVASTAVIGSPTGGTISGAINAAVYYNNNIPFYGNIPASTEDANYTLVAGDAQKFLYHTSATSHTWTIPANSVVAFTTGTVISLVNDSTGTVTIGINADTLKLAGTSGSSGSRTLRTNGVATLIKVSSTTWFVSGSALT